VLIFYKKDKGIFVKLWLDAILRVDPPMSEFEPLRRSFLTEVSYSHYLLVNNSDTGA